MEPTTIYEPFDGDYGDYDYTKLINDIQTAQGYSFGPYREICVTLEVDQLRILCANDKGDEWIDDHFYDIPPEWTLTQLQEMFFGSVYMKTSEYVEPENHDYEDEDYEDEDYED